ncbi:MAG TPA: HAMP domain-containing sensor histidine kinase [Actinospica sp.]|nr:HAMP domain-containing sensor histidine kinase [Actinospica sp.]
MRLWARTPLWARLVLGMLGLAAVGLTVTGAVGVNLFRDYLVDQSGQQLTTVARTISSAHWDKPTYQTMNCGNLPSDNAVELLTSVNASSAAASCAATVGRSTAMPAMPSTATLAAAAESGTPIDETSAAGSAKIEWQIVVVRERFTKPTASAQTHAASFATTPPVNPKDTVDGYVLVATPLSNVDATVAHLDDLDITVDIAVGLALLGLGYALVRRTLRPLREIEEAAAAISAGDLTRRVPHAHPKTEIGQLSRSLNGMLGQIEAAFGAQASSEAEALRSEAHMRQFAADAGHELRTPLASIRGLTELYRQGAADPRRLPDLMRRIEDEATRMGLLVEDLLLLARLDQQRPLAQDRVHLVALAADSITAARARTADRRIELSVESDEAAGDPVITGDENRLRQALDNLLTNAVRHTPDDTPVTVRVRPDEPGRFAVDVIDTGRGLRAEDAARVFERFYRADPSRARTTAQQGSGLGLAIVAAIAQAHGGSATVRSEPGRGACFTLSLPSLPNA